MTQFVLHRETDSTQTGSTHAGPDANVILSGLNDVQQTAVRNTSGPLLIVAGPGSGKTRTLTHRIAYILATGEARPWEILAITFTNKAAREMRERVTALLGEAMAREMWLGTFHATFARVLRREAEHIGFTSDFSIYDSDDSQRILRELLHSHNIDTTQYRPRSIHGLISGAKNRMVTPGEFSATAESPIQEKAAQVYGPYIDRLRAANAMDFDDLLLKPIELFERHPDVLEKYQRRWRFIHIDEYQDTNRAQYILARMLAREHENLCVVGDDAQSIYSFRGADISNILSFQKDYDDPTVIRLEQNYRSTGRIVKLADSIIRNNSNQIKKELWTDNDEGDPVVVVEAISERDEAQKIEQYTRDAQVRMGLLYRDIAVLYRTNAQSRSMEDALRRGGIPYRVIGGLSFYSRREIKDALAYLRLVVNPSDIASLRRVINTPARGIGDKTQQHLFAFANREKLGVWDALDRIEESGLAQRAVTAVKKFRDLIAGYREKAEHLPASEIARDLIRASGILDDLRKEHTPENLVRWENVQELLNAISEFTENGDQTISPSNEETGTPNTLSGFLQEVSLLTDADDDDASDNRVTLMTLHASKGLEFPVVFLTGMEEGLFPLAKAAQDQHELEEERRLFYVGATRAKKLLMLTYARSRYRYGEQQPAIRSRFFDEIDPEVVRTASGQPFQVANGRFQPTGGRSSNEFETSSTSVSYDRMDPHYYRQNLRENQPPATSKGRRVVYDEDESGALVPGMHVEHGQFGEGKVISLEGRGDQAKATVFFPDIGQKKLLLRFARLRRID